MTPRFQPLMAALDNLGANPLRTILSTLGVIIGVASLVAILALGDGLERFGREQLSANTDVETVVVQPETTRQVDGIRVRRDQYTDFSRADLAALRLELGERAAASLVLEGGWSAAVPGDPTARAVIATATLPASEGMAPSGLLAGRYFTEGEVEADARVAVPSAGLAEWYGVEPSSLVGRVVELRGVPYEIVGVRGGASRAVRVEIPLSDATRASMEGPDRRAMVVLRARRVEDVEPVAAAVRSFAASRWGEEAVAGLRISMQKERVQLARRGMLVFKLVMGSIAGISLLVGGIGIMNILLASVFERTREIGIRKATGARQGDILRQFLAESVLIAGIGSLAGIVLGLVAAFGITAAIRALTDGEIYAAFSWPSVAVAAVAALIVGLLSGTYPARRAARLSPIEAMRHE